MVTRRHYRVGEVAKLLSVSPASVRRWCRDGALASIQTAGGHYRVTAAAVDALIAQLTTRPTVGASGSSTPPAARPDRA